jgi:hypothetical protein
MGFVLLVLCCGHSMDMDKPPGFLQISRANSPVDLKENIIGSLQKLDLLTDTIFDPYYFSLDFTFMYYFIECFTFL